MIEYHCVKCGASLVNTSLDFTNRLCAPCCETCREAVIREVKRHYSTWPHDWNGKWSWGKGMWNPARRMDGTGQ